MTEPVYTITADLDTLRSRLGMQSTRDDDLLEDSLATSHAYVRERVYATHLEAPEVAEATLLMASRLYKRRQSPEGVSGWDDLGVVRIVARDPDIERLLEGHIDAYTIYGIG